MTPRILRVGLQGVAPLDTRNIGRVDGRRQQPERDLVGGETIWVGPLVFDEFQDVLCAFTPSIGILHEGIVLARG